MTIRLFRLTEEDWAAAQQAEYWGPNWGIVEKAGQVKLGPAAAIATGRGVDMEHAIVTRTWEKGQLVTDLETREGVKVEDILYSLMHALGFYSVLAYHEILSIERERIFERRQTAHQDK
jgi:hypothetical protein